MPRRRGIVTALTDFRVIANKCDDIEEQGFLLRFDNTEDIISLHETEAKLDIDPLRPSPKYNEERKIECKERAPTHLPTTIE
ncbi:unnamed protein product [Arctia plantaginis]|uniref:Uncharacterized protein n=1 Tax=Arctia plantaginis TaxID=874455 RepID=A0A8S0Z6E5_ARCPL|nr:unnamed protein product [Arctia plantaginis]